MLKNNQLFYVLVEKEKPYSQLIHDTIYFFHNLNFILIKRILLDIYIYRHGFYHILLCIHKNEIIDKINWVSYFTYILKFRIWFFGIIKSCRVFVVHILSKSVILVSSGVLVITAVLNRVLYSCLCILFQVTGPNFVSFDSGLILTLSGDINRKCLLDLTRRC